MIAEHVLRSPPGWRTLAKSLAFDPLRREVWVNTDLLPENGAGAAHHDARVLDAAGRELRVVTDPELQFFTLARDGTGYFAERPRAACCCTSVRRPAAIAHPARRRLRADPRLRPGRARRGRRPRRRDALERARPRGGAERPRDGPRAAPDGRGRALLHGRPLRRSHLRDPLRSDRGRLRGPALGRATPVSCARVRRATPAIPRAMGPGAVAIVLGARLVARSNDTDFPFRQDSDFHYLTGFDHPNAVAVLRTDGGPAFTLFVEPRDPRRRDLDRLPAGRRGRERRLRRRRGAPDRGAALDEAAGAARDARARLPRARPRREASTRRLTEILEIAAHALAHRLSPRPRSCRPARDRPRDAALQGARGARRDAARRRRSAREGHEAAARLARARASTSTSSQAALDYTFRRRGGAGPAYAAIVGGGAQRDDPPLRRERPAARATATLVLIDAGCELAGYASDVTRTLSGRRPLQRRGARRLRGRARGAAGGARRVAARQHARRGARPPRCASSSRA